jgi:hypothetical protein
MIRYLSDEDFNGRIVRGLRLRKKDIDLVRVQDVGLSAASDVDVLEWADENNRILPTHDRRTVPACFISRLDRGLRSPGVIIVSDQLPIGECIEELLLIWECSEEVDWQNQLFFVPLR